jgi:hypothetical protein
MLSKTRATLIAPGICLIAALSSQADNAQNRAPVLLELFTSEGCSSCPPADRLLEAFDKTQPVADAGVIVLSEHVDYWDEGGWKDPYSSAGLTARQSDYGRRLHVEEVYTPQLIVDGQFEVVGSDAAAAKAAIARASRSAKAAVMLSVGPATSNQIPVHLSIAPLAAVKKSATVFVAIAESRAESSVLRGENAGKALSHVAVVRSLVPVGTVSAGSLFTKDISLAVPPGASHPLRIVAFAQDQASGHILGAARQDR